MAEDASRRHLDGLLLGGRVGVTIPSPNLHQLIWAAGDSLPGPGIATIADLRRRRLVTTGGPGLYRGRVENSNGRRSAPPQRLYPGPDRPGWSPTARSGWARPRPAWPPGPRDGHAGATCGMTRRIRKACPATTSPSFIATARAACGGGTRRPGPAPGRGEFTVFRPRPDLGDRRTQLSGVYRPRTPGGISGSARRSGLYRSIPRTATSHHVPTIPKARLTGAGAGAEHSVRPVGYRLGRILAHGTQQVRSGQCASSRCPARAAADPAAWTTTPSGRCFEDSGGALWVGTGAGRPAGTQGGLNWLHARRRRVSTTLHLPAVDRAPRATDGLLHGRTARGRLWLGTNRGRLAGQRARDGSSVRRLADQRAGSAMDGQRHGHRLRRRPTIWVAAWMGGLHRYDPLTGSGTPSGRSERSEIAVERGSYHHRYRRAPVGCGWVRQRRPAGLRTATRRLPRGHLDCGEMEAVGASPGRRRRRVLVSTGAGILLVRGRRVRSYTTRDGPAFRFRRPRSPGRTTATSGLPRGWAWRGSILERASHRLRRTGRASPQRIPFRHAPGANGTAAFLRRPHGWSRSIPDSVRTRTFEPPVHLTGIRVAG